jgi:nucleolar protein 14
MELLRGFAEIYKALDGFIELYEPILAILRSIALSKLPSSIHKRISEYIDTFSRLLKFAHQARKPLLLQAHKPIPIASFVPKFEAHHSSYMRTKHKDPDADRAELAKLKALHRKEKKGAMRELRKDNRFLADVQREKQEAKDREYKARMVKAFAGLESERTEQRKEEKEKRNEKRRANRK